MDTNPTPPKHVRQPYRQYTEEDQIRALAILAENGGNVAATARDTGFPEQTIREWHKGTVRVPSPELVEQRKLERAQRWDELQDAAVTQALARIGDASARDAAVVAGIATDKAHELRGGGAAGQPEDPARLALFRARYAAAQAIQVNVHVHTDATPQPTPMVPVTVIEPQGEGQAGGAG